MNYCVNSRNAAPTRRSRRSCSVTPIWSIPQPSGSFAIRTCRKKSRKRCFACSRVRPVVCATERRWSDGSIGRRALRPPTFCGPNAGAGSANERRHKWKFKPQTPTQRGSNCPRCWMRLSINSGKRIVSRFCCDSSNESRCGKSARRWESAKTLPRCASRAPSKSSVASSLRTALLARQGSSRLCFQRRQSRLLPSASLNLLAPARRSKPRAQSLFPP